MVEQSDVARLYERHGHALYHRCLRLVGNEDEARELLQEAFCQLWRDRARFEGRSSLFTYLYRIATNLSIDRLRRRTTAGTHYPFDETRDRGAASAGPEETVMVLGELAALTEGMDSETLAIGVLSHVDGFTQEEIADALDLSRRTIGKRLKRFAAFTEKRRTILKRDLKLHGAREGA